MKKMLTGWLVIVGMGFVIGCSVGPKDDDVTGSWWLSKISGEGMGMTNTNFTSKAESVYLLNLKSDKTAVITLQIAVPSAGMNVAALLSATWKIDKSYLIFSGITLGTVSIKVSNSTTNYTMTTNSFGGISGSTMNGTNTIAMAAGKLRMILSQSDTNRYMEYTKE